MDVGAVEGVPLGGREMGMKTFDGKGNEMEVEGMERQSRKSLLSLKGEVHSSAVLYSILKTCGVSAAATNIDHHRRPG